MARYSPRHVTAGKDLGRVTTTKGKTNVAEIRVMTDAICTVQSVTSVRKRGLLMVGLPQKVG